MKLNLYILFFSCISLTTFAKNTIVKDFDGDGKFDKVWINQEAKTIVYLLSSTNYQKQSSLPFTHLDNDAFLEETKNGFRLENKINQIVYSSYFKFNKKENNIELVALKRKIESGDYSKENGESSIDTVSKEFIGKWNSLDKTTNKVISLPTLKTKIDFDTIFLNQYNDSYLNKFEQQSANFYKNQLSKLN